MIVLGADMHKSSHTIAGIAAATGEMLGDKTARVGTRGFGEVLLWARGLGADRVWALEDCRDVSGSFERFLIAARRACGPGPNAADGQLAAVES
jgi:transposase